MHGFKQIEKQKEYCVNYFNKLAEKLKDTHEVVGSCNKDMTVYLVPKGTADQITYRSKPANSYRLSDHWTWYASIKKCSDPSYIQCQNASMPPYPRPRLGKEGASRPWMGWQVAKTDEHGVYHGIVGYMYDRYLKCWTWVEVDETEKGVPVW